MQVVLKTNCFIGGIRYRAAGKWPVFIPDEFFDLLPKGAVVVEEDGSKVEVPAEDEVVDTFSEFNELHAHDLDRAISDEKAKILEAEEQRQAEIKEKRIEALAKARAAKAEAKAARDAQANT